MASTWYCRIGDSDAGPFSFEQLAQHLRDGKLTEEGLVRRAEQHEWQRADEVVGLLRAARRVERQAPAPKALVPETPRPVRQPKAPRSKPVSRSWLSTSLSRDQIVQIGLPSALISMGLAFGLGWWITRPPQPPPLTSARMELSIPSRLSQMCPPAPARPSIGDLVVGEPVPVPGIEGVPWLSGPTLSDDLKALVFVTVGSPETVDDLFIAERDDIHEPFAPPHSIETCSGPNKEAYPTLSVDGLELIYTELGEPNHRLMYSSRPDRKSKFGQPRPVEFEGDSCRGQHIDGPQFLGSKRLRFASGDAAYTERFQWIAERVGPGRYRILGKVPLANPWPRYFITAGGRRVYYTAEDGIFLTVLEPGNREFVTPEKLIDAEFLGPIMTKFDSPIWFVPQEDVLFYCSPGLETPDSPDHRLWMIRLR